MIVLGIETATSVCSVGLVDDQRLLAEKSEDAGRRHSIVLLDMIEVALTEVGLTRDRLEGVAVSAGPGSFTGLRIGMGLAKGICLAIERPLVLVSTLHALAVQSGAKAHTVCACLDARHDELYSGVYTQDGSGFANSQPDAGRHIDDLLTVLSPDTPVVGYGIGLYEDRLLAAGLAVLPNIAPSGVAVARVGERKLSAGKDTPLDLAQPNYCKKSQAERLRAGERS
jgi:tRNA threonylcarbamoyladenosine biosynthesis protein TsaB